jgi:hypothetical protein
VQGPVDAHRLVDAPRGEGVFGGDGKPRFLLDQREPVRPVAVDLVGADEDECRFRRMTPGGLEEIERAERVDGEIGVGIVGRPVVRRLGRRVDHRSDCRAVLGEQRFDRVAVADVVRQVAIGRQLGLEARPVRCGARLGAEEVAAHVVVDADDIPALAAKKPRGLRSNQTGASCDDGKRHAKVPLRFTYLIPAHRN